MVHGAVDQLLRVADAGDEVALLIDEGGGQLGGVDLPGAHGHELVADGRKSTVPPAPRRC